MLTIDLSRNAVDKEALACWAKTMPSSWPDQVVCAMCVVHRAKVSEICLNTLRSTLNKEAGEIFGLAQALMAPGPSKLLLCSLMTK